MQFGVYYLLRKQTQRPSNLTKFTAVDNSRGAFYARLRKCHNFIHRKINHFEQLESNTVILVAKNSGDEVNYRRLTVSWCEKEII